MAGRASERAAWVEGFARVLICGREGTELCFGEASDGEERDGLVDRLELEGRTLKKASWGRRRTLLQS